MGCIKSKNQVFDDTLLDYAERERLENSTSRANIRDVYDFSSVLGKGGFGTVKLATLKNGISDKKVAVKILEKSQLKSKMFVMLRELEIMRQLDHPNIIKFYEVYQDDMFFYVCMEYCSGGELLDRITKQINFKEHDAALIMDQILSAINHMHVRGIVHRDIKPENIIFSNKSAESEVKIIDFGLSVKCNPIDNLSTLVGTPMYVSPDVLKGKYDASCDNWSAGVILFVLLVGYPPFKGQNKAEVYRNIQKAMYSMEGREWEQVSDEAMDLVKRLLVVESKKRLTTSGALKHRWVVKNSKISSWASQNNESSTLDKTDPSEKVDPKILNMIKTFRAKSKFRSEVIKIMINMMNEKEIQSQKIAFKQLDTDKTGEIKISQLADAMQKGGFNQTKDQLESIMLNISSKKNSKELYIGYSEFIAVTFDHAVHLKQEKLKSLFKYFDPFNSNFITFDDLKEIFLRNGRNLPDVEIQAMLGEVDLKREGKISIEEFLELMKADKVDFKN